MKNNEILNKNNENLKIAPPLKIKKETLSDTLVLTQLNHPAITVRNIAPNFRKKKFK